MKKNVGGVDKQIRILGGLGLVIMAILLQQWWLVIVGLIIGATGVFGFCGLYTLLGVNTCPISKEKK